MWDFRTLALNGVVGSVRAGFWTYGRRKRKLRSVSEPVPAQFLLARNPDGGQLQGPAFGRHPHSARTNLNVGAGSTATPRAFRTCLSVSVLPSIRKRLRYLVFKWLWTTSVLRRIAPSIAGRAGRLAELSQGQRYRFFPPTLRLQNQFYNFARSTLSSSARLATAGERRPVMKPVWMPIVFASERPCPSFALKIFISDTLPAPDPSAAVPEIRQTPPSVRVPSTSMRKSLIFRARARTSGEARSASEMSGISSNISSPAGLG